MPLGCSYRVILYTYCISLFRHSPVVARVPLLQVFEGTSLDLTLEAKNLPLDRALILIYIFFMKLFDVSANQLCSSSVVQ